MKQQLFSSVIFFLSVCCVVPVFSQEMMESNQVLAQQNACEALTIDHIAQLMDVDKSLLSQEDMSFGKKRSMCYFFTKEGNRKLYIRMAWKSDKAQENKVLENQYKSYLVNGENDIKDYQELVTTANSQILYGIGQDREGKYIHLIRKRFDNQAELQIELTKEVKDDALHSILLDVVQGIH